MIVVTGGAGFIGSQLVAGLNQAGREDLIVVDNLSNGKKFSNLAANSIADYFDKTEFREMVKNRHPLLEHVEMIFHQGACSVTTEWDGRYMMDNNFTYSKELLHFCLEKSKPFIYASSAAVYGVNTTFAERVENENPVNVYGYSKLLFDNYVRRHGFAADSQVAGLRYFNVYGPGESHKGSMASVMFHFNNQLQQTDSVKLFQGSHGYQDGEQLRDFIFVEDVVKVNLWLKDMPSVSGIYNVGTGSANTFNQAANAVISWHGKGQIEFIPFPDSLKESYQSFTQADMTGLRRAGYDAEFTSLSDGVNTYMEALNS